jgi:hypothetical protein
MATDKPSNTTEVPSGGKTAINDTLCAFEGFVEEVASGAAKSATDDETRLIFATSTTTLQSQFKKVTDFVRMHYEKLNVAQKEDIDMFLAVQDGILLGNSGKETTQKAFRSGWFLKFLKWALHWFKEIKKVLREIIAMILDALGIRFPKWLETIFLLLDELYDAIISLLADVFGLDVGKFSSDASKLEVQYLNELYAVEKLRSLRSQHKANESE